MYTILKCRAHFIYLNQYFRQIHLSKASVRMELKFSLIYVSPGTYTYMYALMAQHPQRIPRGGPAAHTRVMRFAWVLK